jgi:DNA-directed RNA polymerase subunit RPC12/RpoP
MSYKCQRCGDRFPSQYYMAAARSPICVRCAARLSAAEKQDLGVHDVAPKSVQTAKPSEGDPRGLSAALSAGSAVIEILAGSLVLAAMWGVAFALDVLDLRKSGSADAPGTENGQPQGQPAGEQRVAADKARG